MNESEGNVVDIHATGKLTDADYDRVPAPRLATALLQHRALRALFYMDPDFNGWDLEAAWANTKLDFQFRESLEKVAIVGAPA